MINKEDYICSTPFNYTEIHDTEQYLCCPSWLSTNIWNGKSIESSFQSEKAKKVRQSILDGTYKYCDEIVCPYLSGLKRGTLSPRFVRKNKRTLEHYKKTQEIKIVNFCFDRSCNLACPSCRIEFINVHGKERLAVEDKMRQVDEELCNDIEDIYLSGTADPFFSNSYRKFLVNLDPKRYPKLKVVHLHTNGTLWTKKFWKKLYKIHHLIESCEISIDAANEKTYNIVRRGGDWNKLMNNLKFIVTIPTFKKFHFSMVVSDDNYKEMIDFHSMLNEIFTKYSPQAKWYVFYNKLTDWGTFTPEVYKKKAVFEKDHILYDDFLFHLNKIKHLSNITTNFAFETPMLQEEHSKSVI